MLILIQNDKINKESKLLMTQQFEGKVHFFKQMSEQMALFFNGLTEFCIKELTNKIEPEEDIRRTEEQQNEQKLAQQLEDLAQLIDSQSFQKEEQIVTKPKKKGRPRLKPLFTSHKPKAPTSSYLLFLHKNKADISAKYHVTNISQVTKAASEEWKKLSQQQKEVYSKRSQTEKIRYHEAMKIYKQQYADEIRQQKRRRQSHYKTKWMQKKNKKKNEILAQKKHSQVIQSDSLEENDDQSSSNSYKSNHQHKQSDANNPKSNAPSSSSQLSL